VRPSIGQRVPSAVSRNHPEFLPHSLSAASLLCVSLHPTLLLLRVLSGNVGEQLSTLSRVSLQDRDSGRSAVTNDNWPNFWLAYTRRQDSCIHILHVVGARPNLMKVAPVMGALKPYPKIKQTLIHTGQHYDANMSDIFFQQLEIPAPDVNLGVGSGSHARQTAEIITRFEPIVLERKPRGDDRREKKTLASAIRHGKCTPFAGGRIRRGTVRDLYLKRTSPTATYRGIVDVTGECGVTSPEA
jgi:hypothetical protein